MTASMTPELRRRMKTQPIVKRFRLWRLLLKLNRLEEEYDNSFVADGGAHISNFINGGRTRRIENQIERVEQQIAEITVPIMKKEYGYEQAG